VLKEELSLLLLKMDEVGKSIFGNAIISTPRSYLYLATFSDKK
jgi:hypothetical protein